MLQPVMRDVATLPKAHLHVHLEGSIRAQTVRELAARYGMAHPNSNGTFDGLAGFLAAMRQVRQCLRTPEDFRRVAVEFCTDEAASGTRYAEVSFAAVAHGERLGDVEMPLASLLDGLAEGQARYGVECQVILDHSRRRPIDRAWRTLELARKFAGRGVVGIGVAGDEAFPLEPFAAVYQAARDAGRRLVHHAGEAGGAESIRAAITAGHADRIGHGIRVLDDPDLTAEVRDRRIPLEVCPSSNVALGFAASLAAHPFPRLRDAGLAVTLNTDNPAVVGTTLADEYARVRDAYGYDDATLAALARSGVEASFAADSTKARLQAEVDAWLS
jgi:adenosine deaminase